VPRSMLGEEVRVPKEGRFFIVEPSNNIEGFWQ
jgi:hypothetical protein